MSMAAQLGVDLGGVVVVGSNARNRVQGNGSMARKPSFERWVKILQ
jgi:hypothetical protein